MFYVDDRVVNNGTKGEHEPCKKYQIDVTPAQVEHGPCCHHRHQDCHDADQRGAPVEEKGKKCHNHENTTDKQRRGEILDRQLQKGCRPKERGVHLQTGQTGSKRRERLLNLLSHLGRTGPWKFLNHQHERGTIVNNGIPNEWLMVFHHRGHVTQTLRWCALDGHLAQLLRRCDRQEVSDPEPVIWGVHPPAGTGRRGFQKG